MPLAVGTPVVYYDALGVVLGRIAAGPTWPRPGGHVLLRDAQSGEFRSVVASQVLPLGQRPDFTACWR